MSKPDAVADVVHELRDAQQLEALRRELNELDRTIDRATYVTISAQSDALRSSAKARLESLQRQRDALARRVTRARASAERGERFKCLCVPRQCIDNPLAKGCF